MQEVLLWLWRAVAIGFLLWVLGFAALIFLDTGDWPQALSLLIAYTIGAVFLTLVVWAVQYVRTGELQAFHRKLRAVVLGNLGSYYWFVLGVLYVAALGNAIWQGATDDMIRGQHLAEGLGTGFAVLCIGAPGWFMVPRRYAHFGHMVGTLVAAAAVYAAQQMVPLS
ncbi:hypothetical protein AB2B41_08585 [Marimonas sp. MJW-29]|uniref:Uncharacterized protein n=1 Tax=Sulfitobacter sediminis TaxID=3234186 RepID=A0ABV3RL10_9RHOB